ncbi:MAG: hypothetical protein MMC33_002449 [Icmadophila ericetorum]|nr:hypothetical protein [Icmadophila ericetorum]
MRLRLLYLLTAITSATALGINCRGSMYCPPLYDSVDVKESWLQDMLSFINTIDPDRWYNDQEKIACLINEAQVRNGLCLYLQNSHGAYGSKIKELVQVLLDHGCQHCGSVPLAYPDTNDVKDGELTSNYIYYIPQKECQDGGLCQVGARESD